MTAARLPKAYASVQDAKTVVHNTRALAQKRICNLQTMQLSRAVRSLRTLTRPQRAFSAAPQPVYEPHVVLHQRPDQDPAADGATRSKAGLRRCEKNGRIFQKISKPPRHAAAATPDNSHAAAATPEQLDAAAATPE